MKIAFFLGMILLLTVTSLAGVPKRSSFAIYLIADPVDARVLAKEPELWKKLPLAHEPVISDADILAYDFSKHAMRLKPEALKRLPQPSVAGTLFVVLKPEALKRLPQPSVAGTLFVVIVNGERIYPGAFYTSLSSIPCDIPVILVDRAVQDQFSSADILLVESGYPQPTAHGKDLRSDVRVRGTLAKLKKLVALRQITDLPLARRSFRPRLSLQDALKLAESYIIKEKIDISPYFLSEAKMIQYGGEQGMKEPRWFFWWVNENGAMGDYVQITVSMEGKVSRYPSM